VERKERGGGKKVGRGGGGWRGARGKASSLFPTKGGNSLLRTKEKRVSGGNSLERGSKFSQQREGWHLSLSKGMRLRILTPSRTEIWKNRDALLEREGLSHSRKHDLPQHSLGKDQFSEDKKVSLYGGRALRRAFESRKTGHALRFREMGPIKHMKKDVVLSRIEKKVLIIRKFAEDLVRIWG